MASAIAGGIVAVAREAWGLIYPKIKSILNFRSNLETLREEIANLINLGTHVKEQVDAAERSGSIPTPAVIKWIQEFEDIKNKMGSIEESLEVNNNKCHRFCYSRCALDAAVTKGLVDVKRLIEAGSFPSGMVIENYQVKKVEHIPAPSIAGQGTASKNLTKVLSLLGDESTSRIGVWGMGGVGKTTLLKNLNNELETNNNSISSSSSSQCFGVVIWVTVSKELVLSRLQTQFLERLNLEVKAGESMERTASRLHHRLKQEEKFLLILDDVWEVIDLDYLGVPQSEFHNGYKVILNSRSLDVCRQMKTDVDVKVDVLNEEESWQLFTKNAGSVAGLEHIEPIAREVSKECGGLPLAITSVGASMRGKTMVALWKDSLNTLQRSTPRIQGIREKVYQPLKWSFDALNFEGTEVKSCLLYCSLYPENFLIRVKELVQCWIAEGLVVEPQNYESSTITGISLVEYLKASSLLEDGSVFATVKMHDVVRDVAMWITSSSDGGCKSLVRSGIDLNQILENEFSEDLDRISLAYNKITSLPDCSVQCPKVRSLLLQGNRRLAVVPERFLLGFPSVKVLNLCETRINRLPSSLSQLGELQALLLRGCQNLVELPPLGGLHSLQVLDCSLTRIEELPEGMENLANLRLLDLSGTRDLRQIRSGIISQLSRIEIIDMTNSFYKWGGKGLREKGRSPFNELRCLDKLSSLYIHLDVSCLAIKNLAWIGRVKRFHLIIGQINAKIVGREKPDGKKVTLSDEGIKWLLEDASKQFLEHRVGKTPADLLKGHCFSVLKSLTISDCRCNFPPATGDGAQFDLLPNLEELVLGFVIYPNPISELVHHLGLRFSKLRTIKVFKCFYLEYLLPSSGSIPTFKNLEEITVGSCDKFVDLFNKSSPSHSCKEIVEHDTSIQPPNLSCIVPNLRILKLEKLPSLVRHNESWQDLELLKVIKLLPQTNKWSNK